MTEAESERIVRQNFGSDTSIVSPARRDSFALRGQKLSTHDSLITAFRILLGAPLSRKRPAERRPFCFRDEGRGR